ncbi:MAG: hypothetical protein R6V49_05630 [Bacteroidales bacterium]
MKIRLIHIIVLFLLCPEVTPQEVRDTIVFRGQIPLWLNINPKAEFPVMTGVRYIPELSYTRFLREDRQIDFEASANFMNTFAFNPFDTGTGDMLLKPYRVWARYSGRQMEIRAGLQKINFGSASMLRPLMWFDSMDPRDPLQLTDGVWGILGRYYFLNNANLWIWGLWGNEQPKTWEIGRTSQAYPELGGRLQYPVPRGEIALSTHYRVADTRKTGFGVTPYAMVPEYRIGFDGKWDIGPGVWIEGSLIARSKPIGPMSNQVILNTGADYTLGIGNGITLMAEHFVYAWGEQLDRHLGGMHFTGTTLSYPLGLSDHLSCMFFMQWDDPKLYSFITWKKQLNKIALYAMLYWNPSEYNLPQMGNGADYYSGQGIQFMVVFHH